MKFVLFSGGPGDFFLSPSVCLSNNVLSLKKLLGYVLQSTIEGHFSQVHGGPCQYADTKILIPESFSNFQIIPLIVITSAFHISSSESAVTYVLNLCFSLV